MPPSSKRKQLAKLAAAKRERKRKVETDPDYRDTFAEEETPDVLPGAPAEVVGERAKRQRKAHDQRRCVARLRGIGADAASMAAWLSTDEQNAAAQLELVNTQLAVTLL